MRDCLIYLRILAAGVLFLFGNSALHAADDCLTKPKPGGPKGTHWYYQTNQATHQKCWYVLRSGTDRARADTAEAQGAPSPAPAPPSAVQRLVNALTGNSDQKPAESTATPAEPTRVHGAKPPTAIERLRRATHRVSRATEHPVILDRTQRDALFREFLNWEAQKKDHVSE